MPQGFGGQDSRAGKSVGQQHLREATNAALVLEPENCLWDLNVGMVLRGDLLIK